MNILWTEFKNICNDRDLNIQKLNGDSAYYLEAWDGPRHFRSSILISDPKNTDQIDFEDNYLPNINKRIVNKTSDSKTKVSVYEPEGESATIVSHDFTDKCSWYQGSLAITNETLESITTTNFKSSKPYWIDLQNGRVYDEDNIATITPSYIPVVKIDDVVQTSGYTIDYVLGEINFNSPVSGVVKASYHYSDKSWFVIKPKIGKILSIKSAEVQFSSNVQLTSPFYFEAWVNHPTYGMIPVPGTRIVYKNAKDFISACNEGQGLIPKWGGLLHDVHVFPFHYARPKPLKYSQNVEIRVYCKTHEPILGEFATATFYVNVDIEE